MLICMSKCFCFHLSDWPVGGESQHTRWNRHTGHRQRWRGTRSQAADKFTLGCDSWYCWWVTIPCLPLFTPRTPFVYSFLSVLFDTTNKILNWSEFEAGCRWQDFECSSTSQRKAESWIFVVIRLVGGIVAMFRAQDQSVIKWIRFLCTVSGPHLFEHIQTPIEYWCFVVHMHEQLKFKPFELLCRTVTPRLYASGRRR